MMLWKHYVFRRGGEVQDLWERMFERRPLRILYISGRGFDTRAQTTLNAFVECVQRSESILQKAELLLVGFKGYQLSDELRRQTDENARSLEQTFSLLGGTTNVSISSSTEGEEDITASTALRMGTTEVLRRVSDQTDIILDVSSLPRVVYLALMTGLLKKLIPNKQEPNSLWANGVNFQVLVAEDPLLDSQIRSEDPSNDLVMIPGFSSALHAESVQDWPLVWFPILGENRITQLQKVLAEIPDSAEICPILPHPSRDPRRADRLLVEYKVPLFDSRQTPMTNIFYVHEAHPFEAYRQLFGAMQRYRKSMLIIGGCRLVVTPLASKLTTVGVGLACFNMRPAGSEQNYGIAIPYAQPTRYMIDSADFLASSPEVCTLLLTGEAYDQRPESGEHLAARWT
jgi:hypothetical protein